MQSKISEITLTKLTSCLLKENKRFHRNVIETSAKGSQPSWSQPVNFTRPTRSPSPRAVFVISTQNIALAPKFSIYVRVSPEKDDTHIERRVASFDQNPRWRRTRQFCAVFSSLSTVEKSRVYTVCLDECVRGARVASQFFVVLSNFVGCFTDFL